VRLTGLSEELNLFVLPGCDPPEIDARTAACSFTIDQSATATFAATTGVPQFLVVDSVDAEGSYTIEVDCVGENDTENEYPECSEAIPISCGDRLSGTTVGGQNRWNAYACSARWYSGPESLFVFEPDGDYEVVVSLTDVTEDLLFARLTECASIDGMANGRECSYRIAFEATPGVPEFFVVDGYDGAEGSYSLTLDCSTKNETDPPGYWRDEDWHGCSWALLDASGNGTLESAVSPENFADREVAEPYCIEGRVEDDESTAAVGFNLNESAATADCGYDASVLQDPPPGVLLGGSGIAVNHHVNSAAMLDLRIQLNSVDGGSWCAPLGVGYDPVFIPYTDFSTTCGNGSSDTFDPSTPISSVSFVVAGEPSGSTYGFCVDGFAAGESPEDAPEYFF
jgi:hypothetical protein